MLMLQLTSYIKDAANATACTLCVCRKAFDEWSPVPLGTITFVVALLWSMDILVKKWVRMVKRQRVASSRPNLSRAKDFRLTGIT